MNLSSARDVYPPKSASPGASAAVSAPRGTEPFSTSALCGVTLAAPVGTAARPGPWAADGVAPTTSGDEVTAIGTGGIERSEPDIMSSRCRSRLARRDKNIIDCPKRRTPRKRHTRPTWAQTSFPSPRRCHPPSSRAAASMGFLPYWPSVRETRAFVTACGAARRASSLLSTQHRNLRTRAPPPRARL